MLAGLSDTETCLILGPLGTDLFQTFYHLNPTHPFIFVPYSVPTGPFYFCLLIWLLSPLLALAMFQGTRRLILPGQGLYLFQVPLRPMTQERVWRSAQYTLNWNQNISLFIWKGISFFSTWTKFSHRSDPAFNFPSMKFSVLYVDVCPNKFIIF